MKTMNLKNEGAWWGALLGCAAALWLAPSFAADHTGKMEKPVIMVPSDLQWTDSPALPSGVKVSMLYGDMKKAEPLGFRIKIPAGGTLAPHTHPVHERVTVISGSFAMGEGEKFDKALLKDMPAG